MNNNSNVGKWDNWYLGLNEESKPDPFRYGNTSTYEIAANFLEDCEIIEDWGVGAGGFLNHCPRAIGVDGSKTPFAQKQGVDLCDYISECDAVHMRHILEHNYNWEAILHNAMKSASKKVCITFFIPLTEEDTTEVAHNRNHGVDVPDLSISRDRFDEIISEYDPQNVDVEVLETATGYKVEIVCKITK